MTVGRVARWRSDSVRMTALEVMADVALYDGRLEDSAALGLRMVEKLARPLRDPST